MTCIAYCPFSLSDACDSFMYYFCSNSVRQDEGHRQSGRSGSVNQLNDKLLQWLLRSLLPTKSDGNRAPRPILEAGHGNHDG